MSDCTYVMVPTVDVTPAMVTAAQQTSMATLRKSLDGTLSVLKYHAPQSPEFAGYTEYTHAQIVVVMQTVAWTDPSAP